MSKDITKKETTGDWRETVLPQIKTGSTVKVHQIIKEKNTKGEEKQRIQIFEGLVLGRKWGESKTATIKVRKVAAGGIGVERIFPINSPSIAKMELTKQAKVRRAKLTFIKGYKKKLKEKIVK